MRGTLCRLLACGTLVCACGDDSSASSWDGEDVHLRIEGTLNGEELAVDQTTDIRCEREYEVPVIDGEVASDMAKLVGFEIGAAITVDGEEREIEIDVEGPNIQDGFAHMGEIEVLPDGTELTDGQAVVEVKWTRLSDDAELLDEDANEGYLVLQLFSGEPGEGGVIIPDNKGKVGFSGELRFSATQVVSVSVTANCGENDLEELVSAP